MIRPRMFDPQRQLVGIFSPSSADPPAFPRRLARSLAALESARYAYVFPPGESHVPYSRPRTPAERASDIHYLIQHQDVGLLMTLTGGLHANRILDHLDWGLLREHRKPIVGFSDATALQLALISQAGLVSMHGPSLLPSFGDICGPSPYSLHCLSAIVSMDSTGYEFRPPDSYSDDFLFWDRDDLVQPQTKVELGWRVVFHGEAEGPLIGGNLDTILALAGTPYWPDFDGSLFFWEAAFCSLSLVERQLETIAHIGVFERIAGMLVGKAYRVSDWDESYYQALIHEKALKYGVPTIVDLNFGHTSPIMTLPIGCRAHIETEPIRLTLLEASVCN